MTVTTGYSRIERLLHRIAFAAPRVQLGAVDVEAALYGNAFRNINADRPIFITSLPRAGTTMLLELLARHRDVATHCYRDMPFVMTPLLWKRLSEGFRKPSETRERAHGDGVQVGYDSPEAFEEILWKAFWPKKFASDRILLWSADEDAAEFRAFLASHMQRLAAARVNGHAAGRYTSKNNANVARLALLKRMFPTGTIVVPIRDPLAQAVSLLRQHERFTKLHREDDFARRYMEYTGHLEFGALHRPIDFPGVDQLRQQYSPSGLNYWVAYWLHAFRHIRAEGVDLLYVSYEDLSQGGPDALRVLMDRLGLAADSAQDTATSEFWSPRGYEREAEAVEPELLAAARHLHEQLRQQSII